MSPSESPRRSGGAFAEPDAAKAWRLGAASRGAYLAAATRRLLEAARIEPGSRVLVVGGGTGDESIEAAELAGRTGEVVLTDVSEPMVREARLAVAAAGHPEIGCREMDVQALEFETGCFDAVLARNVFMFVPDLARGLGEIRRVLRPGGRLAATTWSGASRNPRLGIPVMAARDLGIQLPAGLTIRLALDMNRPDRLAAKVRRAGFADVEVEAVDATAHPPDWDVFLQDLRRHAGTREIAGLVPEALQARFWQSVDRRFGAHRRAGHLPGELLLLAATNPSL